MPVLSICLFLAHCDHLATQISISEIPVLHSARVGLLDAQRGNHKEERVILVVDG